MPKGSGAPPCQDDCLCGKHRRIDNPTYNGRHWRVNDKLRWAGFQICVDCKKKADQWSQIRGTTGKDPSHYKPRCKSCHNKYDWDTNNFTKLTPEEVSQIRYMYRTGRWFQRELGDIYGVTQPTISVIVNDHTWNGHAY